MEVFLPIAQVFVNPIEILLLSAIVGVLSGLFGVGGGFLMTPFLIFLGIPPAYAVANEANKIGVRTISEFFSEELADEILINDVTFGDFAAERQIEINGKDAYNFVRYITPRNLEKCEIGFCKYIIK